ncbi:MAG: carbohydrate kinase family protein [Deltaproteobacteria bacterium]|nr:carbohydrate kinase family protein [Deltaproteobacteria bacterium]
MPLHAVCLGAVNVDRRYEVKDLKPFLRVWPELSPGGEAALTPEEEIRLQELLDRHGRLTGRWGGGQAANVAFALARMGLTAALVGRVGADEDGKFLRDGLEGVNLDYLTVQGASGRAYILVDPSGERTILVAPNTNDEVGEEDIPWDFLAQTRYIHLTSFVGDRPLAVQRQVAVRLGDRIPLSLDPGELYARRGWRALVDILDHAEVLLVTEREWQLLGGKMLGHPPFAPPLILIKRGAQGARMITPMTFYDFPAEPVSRVVDTLGAGDVFAAGYLAGRVLGLTPPWAARLANRTAAVSLMGPGREHYPDRKFLEKQLEWMG